MACIGEDETIGLSKVLQEKARDELGEGVKCRQEVLQKLREMISSDPEIHCQQDDAFLLMFLRGKKFDLDKTAKLIHRYYKTKAKYPQFFTDYRPSAVGDYFEKGIYVMLPTIRETDPQPIYFRPRQWDPSSMCEEIMWKGTVMHAEKLVQQDERTQVNGFVHITDMAGMSWVYAKYMTPYLVRFLIEMLQNSTPGRVKAMHYVNVPSVFAYMIAMLRPFLSKKLRRRVYIHSNLKTFHDHFDLCVVPECLGGSLDIQPVISKWVEIMADSEDMFISMEKYGVKKEDRISTTSGGIFAMFSRLSWK